MEKMPNANHVELPDIYDEEGRVVDEGTARMMADEEAPYHKKMLGKYNPSAAKIEQGNKAGEELVREIIRQKEMLERVENIGTVIQEQEKAKEAEAEAEKVADKVKEDAARAAILSAFDKE